MEVGGITERQTYRPNTICGSHLDPDLNYL